MEIANEQIGAEGSLDLKLEDGKLSLSVVHQSKGGEVSLSAKLDPEYFVNKLTAAIPGGIDDAVAAMLLTALKKA